MSELTCPKCGRPGLKNIGGGFYLCSAANSGCGSIWHERHLLQVQGQRSDSRNSN